MSLLLFTALVVVFNALVAGIAWINSPKARARAPGKAVSIYGRIFFYVSMWVFPLPVMRLGQEVLQLNEWVEGAIMAVVALALWAFVEWRFKPLRTMAAAYREPQSGAEVTQ